MPNIMLYPPKGDAENYEVESYSIRDNGVLFFRIEGDPAFDIQTTVPFIIRNTVEPKKQSPSSAIALPSSRSRRTRWP